MSKPVCLIVCGGKDCRDGKGFDAVMRLAADTPGSLEAPCQGLCHGPIIAIKQGRAVLWFSHVRSKSMRKSVARALQNGPIDPHLAEREVAKRRNTIRHKGRLKRIAEYG